MATEHTSEPRWHGWNRQFLAGLLSGLGVGLFLGGVGLFGSLEPDDFGGAAVLIIGLGLAAFGAWLA